MRTVLALVVSMACACQLLVGVRDRTLEDGSVDLADSTAGPACGGADLASDPKNCGYCGHACEACIGGLCPFTDIVNIVGPRAFDVDDAHIYVSAQDGVHVYAKDGTPERAWIVGPTVDVRAFEGNAYWIKKPNDLFVGFVDAGANPLYSDDAGVALALAIDPNGVFWATNRNGLRRVLHDGGGPTVLIKDDQNMTMRAHLIARDGYVYRKGNGLARVPADAGANADAELLVTPPVDTFTVSGSRVYHAHALLDLVDESVDWYDLDGGERVHVRTIEPLSRMAVSNGRVYADLVSGKVIVFAQDMAPVVLAKDQMGSFGIAVDDTWVYWMTGIVDDAGTAPGTIRRVRK